MRIPLGGVAAFKQDKSFRTKFLSRFPAIRPRCRRSSSSSSISSGLDDFFDSVLVDIPPLRIDLYGVDDDDDDDETNYLPLDVSSISHIEGSESVNDPDLDSIFLLENVDVESQHAILEEIRRERELSLGLPWSQDVLAEEAPASGSEASGTARELELPPSGTEAGNGPASDDGSREGGLATPVLSRPDSLELDITVVLKLISDMEESDRQEEAVQATPARLDEKQVAQPTTTPAATEAAAVAGPSSGAAAAAAAAAVEASQARPAQRQACRRSQSTRSCTRKECARRADERQDHQSDDEDWKHRAITGPGIPRPKLVTFTDPEERTTRTPRREEAAREWLEALLLQKSTAGPASSKDDLDLAPAAERWRKLELRTLNTVKAKPAQQVTCREQQPDLTISDVLWERRNPELKRLNAVDAEPKTPLEKEERLHTACINPEESEDWGTHEVNLTLTEEARRRVTEPLSLRQLSDGEEETSDGQHPGEERLQELRRVEAVRERIKRFESEKLGLDTDMVVSEDPVDWVRRIRQLQRRKLAKAASESLTVGGNGTQTLEPDEVIRTDCEGKGVAV